ncbi:MAG: hypothetical protein B6I28_00865 [Fusobacteriia bacterium 4572_132]|nr:MAG: hypothetical protein B6I28_00865 [Fusobacteriia bacterium 4572_132]
MEKKIYLLLAMVFFMGCSADVTINTISTNGGPISNAKIQIYDSSGKTLIAEGSTDTGGTLNVSLDYDKYRVKSSKEEDSKYSYGVAEGNLEVNIIGAMTGISIDMTMSKVKVVEKN